MPCCLADKAHELKDALVRKKEIESQVRVIKSNHERSVAFLNVIQERIKDLKLQLTTNNELHPVNKSALEALATKSLPEAKRNVEDTKEK